MHTFQKGVVAANMQRINGTKHGAAKPGEAHLPWRGREKVAGRPPFPTTQASDRARKGHHTTNPQTNIIWSERELGTPKTRRCIKSQRQTKNACILRLRSEQGIVIPDQHELTKSPSRGISHDQSVLPEPPNKPPKWRWMDA
jgi:hypothetical protein